MTSYNGRTYSWMGRQLQGFVCDGLNVSYKYNANGQRIQKIVAESTKTTTWDYYYNGSTLAGQIITVEENGTLTSYTMTFMYDESGNIFGFNLDGVNYYYIKNAQNDVMAISDNDGNIVVSYQYDSWGKINNCIDVTETNISALNPYTYRSYYYDTETQGYYLKTRYYYPELHRFICADNEDLILSSPYEFTDKNLYSYCDNNPVVRADDGGDFWNYVIGGVVGAVVGGVSAALNGGDWKSIALGASVGAVGGLLAASGIPVGFQIIAGGLLNGGSNLASQTLIEGKSLKQVSWFDIGIDTAIGAGASALSYGVTKNATKAAENTIKKGINKIVAGKDTLASTGRYGRGTIKKGLGIMRSGIKSLNTAHGKSSVIGSLSSGFTTSVKNFFKRLFW